MSLLPLHQHRYLFLAEALTRPQAVFDLHSAKGHLACGAAQCFPVTYWCVLGQRRLISQQVTQVTLP